MKNKKGQKGFIKQPEEKLKNKRISTYFTQSEYYKIVTFAKENNISYTELIRSRLKDIIE
jgi:N-acetyl-beta-hexosaminidase